MNRPHLPGLVVFLAAVLVLVTTCGAADPPALAPAPAPADAELAAYFRAECDRLEADCLADIHSPADWSAKRETLRRQLLEMLGLDPLPEKTDLRATVTGTVDGPSFTVENVHFQSRPHLYVTGNLYLPKDLDKPAPAVLYVCGHGKVKKGDVSYGNKVYYQHHPAWFASHGYVCLAIDSLELGEIEGIHHGTYREGLWWWNSRGYTPAGVEAWNCIRALDYLQSRKEVDGSRLGVTGRSGGGAYSWWVTALDDRIRCAVPVAGITDVHNHVVDGCVEGHCDCMFFVNTWRWDYPAVAALAAPRPLLIANSDKDSIFPLDGVQRLYWKVRGVYGLGKEDKPYTPLKTDLGLQVSEGPHADTPELQVAAFRWFNRHLKGEDTPIEPAKKNLFEPEQLRVFKEGLPPDAINARIQETFVPLAPPAKVPESSEQWTKQRDAWMEALREKVFRGWPADGGGPPDVREAERGYEFSSQPHARLRLDRVREGGARVVLCVGDDAVSPGGSDVYLRLSPRGTGAGAWTGDEKKQAQIRRRFMLLGQTVEGMQVWDVRRAIQAVRATPGLQDVPIRLEARGEMAGVALYASLFEPPVAELHLHDLPKSHMQGPHFLNVLRFLDMPQALAMAAERTRVVLHQRDAGGWEFAMSTARALGWPPGQLTIEPSKEPAAAK
jgi:dienelactone hydrolase